MSPFAAIQLLARSLLRRFVIAGGAIVLLYFLDLRSGLAVEPQYQWTSVTNSAAWAPRDGAGALVFQDKMWLLGGWNPNDKTNFPKITNNEVWSSTNGANWILVKPNTFKNGVYNPATDWEGRHTAGYVVHDDKMWIVGGDANQGHYQNDVWNSTDGIAWTQVNSGQPVPWGPRVLHYTLQFDDKIWVMGGQTIPQIAPASEAFYRDIWNSSDGVNWQQVQPQEPFWPQRGMIGGAVVFNDRMWILGGGTYDTPQTPQRKYFNDVWSSADGVNWTQHLANAPWVPRQYHDVAVFDGQMWVMEGYDGTANRKDVWHSSDGVNWNQVPNTPWNPRHAASVFSYDDALWVVAGNNMERDVWKLTRKSSDPEPGCAVSMACITFEEPTYSATFTHSGLPAGTINTQDGWDSLSGLGVGNMNVTTTVPIAGQQSLLVNNNSNSAGSSVRSQASGLLDVGAPASMSWLVRVDALGGGSGAAATRGVEFGITTDPATGTTPFTIIFNDAGGLQYYNGGNVSFSGNPTYAIGTVYRVDITNISDGDGTYDAAIFNNLTNGLVASVTGAPLQISVGDAVHFYALRRGNTTGNAMIDNIFASASILGDYNNDGQVDTADYVVWRETNIGGEDGYNHWRRHFGQSATVNGGNGSSLSAVPEPASIALVGLLVPHIFFTRWGQPVQSACAQAMHIDVLQAR